MSRRASSPASRADLHAALDALVAEAKARGVAVTTIAPASADGAERPDERRAIARVRVLRIVTVRG